MYKGCTLCTGDTFAPGISRHKSAEVFRYMEKHRVKESHGNAYSCIWQGFILRGNKTTKMNIRSAQIWEKIMTFVTKPGFTFRHPTIDVLDKHSLILYIARRTKCLLYCSGQLKLFSHCNLYQFWKKLLQESYSSYTALQTTRLTDQSTLSFSLNIFLTLFETECKTIALEWKTTQRLQWQNRKEVSAHQGK